ncbi:MAG: methyltransferase domain-containing protein [Chloroflexota bacterium]
MYITPDLIEQRKQIQQAFAVQPGDQILDVGSGPGFLAGDIGESVGSTGWVCGIDISEPLLAVAKAHCAHQPWVEFFSAEAATLPFPDGHFDAVISTQVLEYLPDVNTALNEIYRVLRAGGHAVILDTDWDSIVWHTTNRARMNHILTVWDDHTTDPRLPRTLAQRIHKVGFQVESQQIIPIFNPHFDTNTFSNHLIDLIVPFVSGRQGVTSAEALTWAQELRQLGNQGDYFFSLNRYLFIAKKA